MAAPRVGRVLRPRRIAATRLLRLHETACRTLGANKELLRHTNAADALERDLMHALVDCIAVDAGQPNWKKRQRYADILVRFEAALTAAATRHFSISEISSTIGVPERTLRVCCAEFLGMCPTRYLLLRRLNKVRSALRHANPATASVAEIARSYQFLEPGRFAVTYRRIFGEKPSATLSREW